MLLCNRCDTRHRHTATCCRKCGHKRLSYAPSPIDIRDAARRERAKWSRRDEEHRLGVVPECHVYEFPRWELSPKQALTVEG